MNDLEGLFRLALVRKRLLTREWINRWSDEIEDMLVGYGCKGLKERKLGAYQWARMFATLHVQSEGSAMNHAAMIDIEDKVERLSKTWGRALANLESGGTKRTNDKLLMQSAVAWFRKYDTGSILADKSHLVGSFSTETSRIKVRGIYDSAVASLGKGVSLAFSLDGAYHATDVSPSGDVTSSEVDLIVSDMEAGPDGKSNPATVDVFYRFGPSNSYRVVHTGYVYPASEHKAQLVLWDILNDSPVFGSIMRGESKPCLVGTIHVTIGERQFDFVMSQTGDAQGDR